MPLKRPVTLPQARRWPAAAARRESFCARMGGMRERLTGERAARDPASPINRALAAWDCDELELLQRKHVSKGIRMRVTSSKVGSEAKRAPARKNPAAKPAAPVKYRNAARAIKGNDPAMIGYAVHRTNTPLRPIGIFRSKADAVQFAQKMADKYRGQFAVSRIKHMGYVP